MFTSDLGVSQQEGATLIRSEVPSAVPIPGLPWGAGRWASAVLSEEVTPFSLPRLQ